MTEGVFVQKNLVESCNPVEKAGSTPDFCDVQNMAASLQTNDREVELIKRVCRGEHEAFYELVRPYERAIYFAAMGVLNNPADAEEAAQEAVLKAFHALASFRFEAKFSTWIIQIAINESRMKLRKDRRHLYESIDPEREDEEGDYKPREVLQRRPLHIPVRFAARLCIWSWKARGRFPAEPSLRCPCDEIGKFGSSRLTLRDSSCRSW